MKLNLTLTAASALSQKGELSVNISYIDPLADNQQQQATLLINCRELLPFIGHASAVGFDLFLLAACSYGVDRIIKRRPYSVDGWSRELVVEFPVQNSSLWNRCKSDVENLLSFLTGDYWTVSFTDFSITWPAQAIDNPFASIVIDQVNLFSGGLDSLIGAIDALAAQPLKQVLLVSHYDQDIKGAKSDQNDLFPFLKEEYNSRVTRLESVAVHVVRSAGAVRETTLRSRSLMFISLGILASTACLGNPPVIVPENGSVSLNYPLSSSRRSACSTRTTHPRLLAELRNLLAKVGLSTAIKNPYEFDTKGKMVRNCINQELLVKTIAKSNSCGKRGHHVHWTNPMASHCGVCMPCVYRQAALIGLTDETEYGSVFTEKRREDILACQEFLQKPLSRNQIRRELLINGLNEVDQLNQYVSVVEETRLELQRWMTNVEQTV